MLGVSDGQRWGIMELFNEANTFTEHKSVATRAWLMLGIIQATDESEGRSRCGDRDPEFQGHQPARTRRGLGGGMAGPLIYATLA